MNFDLRLPIGLLFSFYGVLLTGYGIATKDSKELYERSLNININLIWGLVMLVFGVVMLWLALGSRREQKKNGAAVAAAVAKPKTPTGV
jgi:hypothetical protein